MAAICTMTATRSNCAQCSAILPLATRLISTPGMVMELPVAGTPNIGVGIDRYAEATCRDSRRLERLISSDRHAHHGHSARDGGHHRAESSVRDDRSCAREDRRVWALSPLARRGASDVVATFLGALTEGPLRGVGDWPGVAAARVKALQRARDALGDEADAHFARGAAMHYEGLVAYAIESLAS